MSFVPVTGPATFRPGDPPRDAVVAFSDARRTVELPMRAALPVLTKAHARDDLHPSVGLLSGAALLGLRIVAAGRFGPAEAGSAWEPAALTEEDTDRVRMLARARAHDDLAVADAEDVVRRVVAAVVDTMPRVAPTRLTPRAPARARSEDPDRAGDFASRLQARVERLRSAEHDPRPHLVGISLRVEAAEEELVAGAVRLVLQVHDEQDPLHLCDAARLWTEGQADHGFGERARTHATIALRAAADAWPVLDRMLALRVPDEITLDGTELAGLLEDGVAALRERGVDVLWPRSLGRDLTTSAVLDRRTPPGSSGPRQQPLHEPMFGPEAVFAFTWQVALHGEPLTPEEMDRLVGAASPVLKLRGSWTVVDPAVARRARKRLLRTAKPAEALAAALTGVVPMPSTEQEGAAEAPVVVGASLLKVRDRIVGAATREPIDPPSALAARLRDYQRHGLTWLAELTSLGLGACLADDMGLGKTVTLIGLHLHRAAAGHPGPTLVVCPASLLGNWEAEIARFAPGVPVRRFHGGATLARGEADGASC